MLWLHQKYLLELSPLLIRFKRTNSTTWNCRCPLCGDSSKSQTKSRGYFYIKSNRIIFHCHNCSETIGLPRLLERLSPTLSDQYKLELLTENQQIHTETQVSNSIFVKGNVLSAFPTISQLSDTHPARSYVLSRSIPAKYHYLIHWVKDFEGFINSIIPGKFNEKYSTGRLVFPLMDTSDNLIGVQGRALDSESIRYITIAFDRTKPLAFGTDRIDWNRIFYVVEGPIDSMFLDNSLAVLGAGLVEKLSQFSHDKDRAVIVYDNEPRNPDIVRGLKKSIDRGYRTVIWPENWQYKDLNDYIQKTVIDPTNQNSIIRQTSILLGILEDHTFRGLQAQMEFTKWKKV